MDDFQTAAATQTEIETPTKQQEKEWSNLAKIVYARTYSRVKEDGTQETWEDTVKRVIEGNVSTYRGTNLLEPNEESRLFYYIYNRKAMPAGRGLWFSGTEAQKKLGGIGLTNCFHLSADTYENFYRAQDMLMLGGGVGMSVEHRFVSKLPKIKKGVEIVNKETNDADFIVPDSREGWVQLTKKVLKAFFETGEGFSYSGVLIRGAGEVIKSFGGKASGKIPLIKFVEKISAILKNREGKALRPIDCLDIICCIGEMVVAGNVRRSALLVQGDCWDKEFLKAKRWDLGPIPTQRAMANLSVVCDDIDDLHPAFWQTYVNGEPFGIINRTNMQKYARMGELKKDTGTGVNPCKPLNSLILTDEGYITFAQALEKDSLKVLTPQGFKKATKPFKTGEDRIVSRILLSNGTYLYGTPDHLHMNSDGEWKRIDELQIGDRLKYISESDINLVDTQQEKEIYRYKDYVSVVDIEPEYSVEDVYDITVDSEEHLFIDTGVVTHNCAEIVLEGTGEACNLAEIFLPNLSSEKEFMEAARLMYRWTKRVSCESYHQSKTDAVVKKNRRLGIGITGCLQSNLFNPDLLDKVHNLIKNEDISYAKALGVNESIRYCTVKPSGTLSLLGDVTPGIHPAYSRYYIRRMRLSANDSLIPLLTEAGYYLEPVKRFDGTFDHDTLVAEFPCMTPEGTPVADEDWDTWKQLEILKMAQKYWSDNSVSVTVYYKKKELPEVKKWLEENLSEIKTISFLCHSDHGFDQSPYEAITKEQYEKMSKPIKPIEFDRIGQGKELDNLECSNGVCPVR